MSTRTVRLDREAENVLKEVRDQLRREAERRPFDVYRELDLGPGGYASGPASEAKRAVWHSRWNGPPGRPTAVRSFLQGPQQTRRSRKRDGFL